MSSGRARIIRDTILIIMKKVFSLGRWAWIALLGSMFGLLLAVFVGVDSSAYAQVQGQPLVIESNTSHIVLELETPSYNIQTYRLGASTYADLTVPGYGNTSEVGKPQLPIKGTMLGIPPGAQATLRIITDQSQSSILPNPPLPVPTPQIQIDPRQTLPRNTGNAYIPNAGAYAANALYPADVARIATTGNWRSQHYITVEFHPFQYNAASRQLIMHQRLRVEIAFTYPRGPTTQAIGGSINEGSFETVFQNAFANYSTAKNWRTNSVPAQQPRAPAKTLSPTTGTWFKLGVSTDGIYKVTCDQLATANGGSLAIDPTKLQLFKQVFTSTVEYAINVLGTGWNSCSNGDTGDYIEFYGQAVNTKYTDTNVYWLTYGNTAGKRMARRGSGGSGACATFTNTIHLEQNLVYRSYIPIVEGYDHWYWTCSTCH